MNQKITYLFLLALCVSCSDSESLATISVSETAGIDRPVEYVNTTISLKKALTANDILTITDIESETTQAILNIEEVSNENQYTYAIMFPVQITANETRIFEIRTQNKFGKYPPIELMLSEDKLSIENQYYKIRFGVEDDMRGGQINGIELKSFRNQLLQRGHIAMHWAPNFSKSNSEGYFNMEDLPADSENIIQSEAYRIVKERSGITDSVPEIHVQGRYEFYADQPYFLFESTMKMEKEVELDLLRNDEMTMDSLFTHVIYPKKNGSIRHLDLYDELDVLEHESISDNAEWVAFYNANKGFGFGSIRLSYDNRNIEGKPSPTHKPYTKISRATSNGRYWNRVLSDTIQTFPKGSRYHEKNAYLIFQVDSIAPEKQLLHYVLRFKNPLKVTVE